MAGCLAWRVGQGRGKLDSGRHGDHLHVLEGGPELEHGPSELGKPVEPIIADPQVTLAATEGRVSDVAGPLGLLEPAVNPTAG